MQGDAGADPGFFLVEIDSHHLALAHADEVVYQSWLAPFGPEKHHPDLGLGAPPIDGLNTLGVLHLLLQNPTVRRIERSKFFLGRLHLDAQSGEGIERLEDVVVERFTQRKLIGKKRRRGVCAPEEGKPECFY